MSLFRRRESSCVLRGGRIVQEFYGKDYAPDLFVEWGSITKLVTAEVVSRLVDRGLLAYDQPAREVLGPLPPSVTVGGLVTHTSGLPRVHAGMKAGILQDPYSDTGPSVVRAAVAKLAEGDLLAPGSMTYSNLGYAVLGLIIEEVTGRPWFEVVREQIADPQGLCLVLVPPADKWAHIRGFDRQPHRPWDLENSAYAPAGALWSTLRDLARYGAYSLATDAVQLPQRAWQADRDRYWHNGQTRDAGSCLIVEPGRQLVVAAHTLARLPGAADRLAARIADRPTEELDASV